MESPFRSEAAAFRFLLITIGAFALIVLASPPPPRLASSPSSASLRWQSPSTGVSADRLPDTEHVTQLAGPDERRVLVVANETVAGEELLSTISTLALRRRPSSRSSARRSTRASRRTRRTRIRPREEAQTRLDVTLARLASVGIQANGVVGDGDPLVAVDDAVRTFGPNEIVISTHPPGKSNWLERGVVDSVRARYDVPVTHVVVDLAAAGERA